jgi:hypothetical protein
MNPIPNFKVKVLKALRDGIINKDEAMECMRRGGGFFEVPIFYDGWNGDKDPLKIFVDALEKMKLIEPLIRLNDDKRTKGPFD